MRTAGILIAGRANGWGASAKTQRNWRLWLMRELGIKLKRGRPRKRA